MSKSNASENAILALIFNATTWNLIAENDTTSPGDSDERGSRFGCGGRRMGSKVSPTNWKNRRRSAR